MLDPLLAALSATAAVLIVFSAVDLLAPSVLRSTLREQRFGHQMFLVCTTVLFLLLISRPRVLFSSDYDEIRQLMLVLCTIIYVAVRFRSFLRVVRPRR